MNIKMNIKKNIKMNIVLPTTNILKKKKLK